MRNGYVAFICTLLLAGCAERNTANRPTISRPDVTTVSAAPGVIPAGTTLEVRTNEEIDSANATEGRSYSAQITRDVVSDSGETLIPHGSPAELVVTRVKEAGRVRGTDLRLGLQAVT